MGDVCEDETVRDASFEEREEGVWDVLGDELEAQDELDDGPGGFVDSKQGQNRLEVEVFDHIR